MIYRKGLFCVVYIITSVNYSWILYFHQRNQEIYHYSLWEN